MKYSRICRRPVCVCIKDNSLLCHILTEVNFVLHSRHGRLDYGECLLYSSRPRCKNPPKDGLLRNISDDDSCYRLRIIKHTSISLLRYGPSNEDDQGVEPFSSCPAVLACEPISASLEAIFLCDGDKGLKSNFAEKGEPNLTCYHTGREYVLHVLLFLVTYKGQHSRCCNLHLANRFAI